MAFNPDTQPVVALNDGHEMPVMVYGTSGLQGVSGMEAVRDAIRAGYRAIDSAQRYNNEMSVGAAIKASGVPREDLWVITKVHGGNQGLAHVRPSLIESMRKLDVDVIDMVLIHWPNPSVGLAIETWMALIEAKTEGLVRSIGVSNFAPDQLDEIIEATWVTPAVNQIPIDPWSRQTPWREYCHQKKIMPMAWSPSGHRAFRDDQTPSMLTIEEIAANHEVSIHQVALAWHRHMGHMVVAGSADPKRRRANLASLSLELSNEEVAALNEVFEVTKHTQHFDPHHHEEW